MPLGPLPPNQATEQMMERVAKIVALTAEAMQKAAETSARIAYHRAELVSLETELDALTRGFDAMQADRALLFNPEGLAKQ